MDEPTSTHEHGHEHERLERVTQPTDPLTGAPGWQRSAHAVVASPTFQGIVVAVILANALVLGLETYESIVDRMGGVLDALDSLFLAFFVFELATRLAAVGMRVDRFVRNGWNVFDASVVLASAIPGLPDSSTLLRLARLLRVARLLRLFPDLRVLLDGLRRAAPPAFSLVALTFLLVYLYAIVGWTLFHEQVPQYFGTLGESMLTLFTLLTIEGWNGILEEMRPASPWAIPYTLSFILIGTFVVLNLVIGVVITSLDEAYGARRREHEGEQLADAIDDVRRALDTLESRLSDVPGDPRMTTMGERT
jgi:voltage-gated sodium channel